jgi:FkbM family methyltransferase
MRRNFAKEIADGRVVVVDKGVWNEEAWLPLVVVEGCSVCNSVTHKMPATIKVPLTTIDHAMAELHIEHVDFIKLDIENAEANALRGAASTNPEPGSRVLPEILHFYAR